MMCQDFPFKKNILIFHTGQLGDTAIIVPFLKALKNKYCDYNFYLLTDMYEKGENFVASSELLSHFNFFHEIFYYYPKPKNYIKNLFALTMILLYCRSLHFEIIFSTALRTDSFRYFRDIFIFKFLCNSRKFRLLNIIKYPPEKDNFTSLMPKWQQLLEIAGADCTDNAPTKVKIKAPHNSSKIFNFLSKLNSNVRLISISSGSKMPSKKWPDENFKMLGEKILNSSERFRIIFIGSTEDEISGDIFCNYWGLNKSFNFAGKLNVLESAYLLSKTHIFIGVDSGPMHLAGLVGVPVIGIFSTRDYSGLWNPIGDKNKILRKELPCSGCMLNNCNFNNECLKQISVDEVYNLFKSYKIF
jgi:ADP-heptose:LPS heptosyltransferase